VDTLAQVIAEHARKRPGAIAFIAGEQRLDWGGYDERSDRLAGLLGDLGMGRGERIGVLLPDGPDVHVAFVAAEKAGLVVMGIGPRAGEREIRHLLGLSGARALLAPDAHRGLDLAALARSLDLRFVASEPGLGGGDTLEVDGDARVLPERTGALRDRLAKSRLGARDLFLLNSTSGTTGLPKCVTHDQARWLYFHSQAVATGGLKVEDVFLSALPAPFGFGLWTAHFTPTLLGAPTVLLENFSAADMIRQMAAHRVTVLAAVSTQFIMMLDAPELHEHDLSTLRVLYTGGEAVPYERAAEFEERTGAVVLQFYGSNETGMLSGTTHRDSREVRLQTAGHVIPEMQVRLLDGEHRDVGANGRGIPACKGPANSPFGYYGDPKANQELYTEEGWMLTGDIATIDDQGVLRVIGRTADFIIRGGKNISGPVVEAAVSSHPAVTIAAAVAMPDGTFGERVCVYVELREGETLTLDALLAHLGERGESKENHPERLVIMDALPRSSGGKVAKQELRDDIIRRLRQEES